MSAHVVYSITAGVEPKTAPLRQQNARAMDNFMREGLGMIGARAFGQGA
jgi:hypothetical protein